MSNFSDKLFAKADKWLADYKKAQEADREARRALRREEDAFYNASNKAREVFGKNSNVHILSDKDFKNYIRELEMNYAERPGISQRWRDFRSGKDVFLQPSELEEFIDTINNPKDWLIEE